MPVFPLPGTVLFPGTAVPLHIFEPRYLAMVDACMADNAALAVVMQQPGGDAAAARVPIYDVACGGRIVHAERLPQGRLNILVHGLSRLRLVHELPLIDGYRRFMTSRIETTSDEVDDREMARLQSCVLSLRSSAAGRDDQLVEVLASTSDPVALTDILSAVLVSDPERRQLLLETQSLRKRVALLIDAAAEVMVRVVETDSQAKLN